MPAELRSADGAGRVPAGIRLTLGALAIDVDATPTGSGDQALGAPG